MYFTSPTTTITPAMVSVAMSRSDSRDSNCSTISESELPHHFTSAPMTVSYSTSPTSYLTRTISNTSSTPSITSPRRASSSMQRRESSSQWIPSPYRSCQLRSYEQSSAYLSDDDLLYIPPPTSHPEPLNELPISSIPTPKKELTTEEQIAMLRGMQEKEQEQELVYMQQQRRAAAAVAQKAVRFSDSKPRRPSNLRRKTPTVKKGMSQMSH